MDDKLNDLNYELRTLIFALKGTSPAMRNLTVDEHGNTIIEYSAGKEGYYNTKKLFTALKLCTLIDKIPEINSDTIEKTISAESSNCNYEIQIINNNIQIKLKPTISSDIDNIIGKLKNANKQLSTKYLEEAEVVAKAAQKEAEEKLAEKFPARELKLPAPAQEIYDYLKAKIRFVIPEADFKITYTHGNTEKETPPSFKITIDNINSEGIDKISKELNKIFGDACKVNEGGFTISANLASLQSSINKDDTIPKNEKGRG